MTEYVTSPLTDFMFYKADNAGIPLSGTFELTPLCNFSCRMCYVRKTAKEVRDSKRPMMTLDQWLTLAGEACDAGMLYLLLTGGEPTAWPDFWKLYEELIHMGLLVSINTNGSKLDDAAIQKLIQLPPRRVNLTLYGADDSTYENLCQVKNMFSKVDHSIHELLDAGIQVKLNCSLTPFNADDLEKLVAYAQERGLILDIATYMFPPLRRDESMVGSNERFTPEQAARYRLKAYQLQYGEEKYISFLRSIQNGSVAPPGLEEGCVDPVDGKIRCRAGKSSFWVTWDGWMTPCGMMTDPKMEIQDRPFRDVWQEVMEASHRIELSGVCGKCPNMQLCHACAAMAQTETGRFSGIPSYLCETVKEMKQLAEEQLQFVRRTQK